MPLWPASSTAPGKSTKAPPADSKPPGVSSSASRLYWSTRSFVPEVPLAAGDLALDTVLLTRACSAELDGICALRRSDALKLPCHFPGFVRGRCPAGGLGIPL